VPVQRWWCKIGDQTFYSSSEASAYWYADIDSAVKNIYKTLLERDTNDNDIAYWHSVFPFNNCNNGGWNSSKIRNQVLTSDEYKNLLAKKEAEKPTPTPKFNSTIESETDYSWLWWAVPLTGYVGYVIYASRK
jgi:hypothetical protein